MRKVAYFFYNHLRTRPFIVQIVLANLHGRPTVFLPAVNKKTFFDQSFDAKNQTYM